MFLHIHLVAQVTETGNTTKRVSTGNDSATGIRKTGDPFAKLPSNIERLTYFGERADISPDNQAPDTYKEVEGIFPDGKYV